MTIRIIQGKLLLAILIQSVSGFSDLIERSAKIIDKISTMELITLQKSINLIKELKSPLRKTLFVLKKKLKIIIKLDK